MATYVNCGPGRTRSVVEHDRTLRQAIERATSVRQLRLATATLGTVGRVTKLRFIRGGMRRPLEFL